MSAVIISIGITFTIYNVQQKNNAKPSAAIIAVIGSKAIEGLASNGMIIQPSGKVNNSNSDVDANKAISDLKEKTIQSLLSLQVLLVLLVQ